MGNYVIEAKQVVKSYGQLLALDHVDIHVKQGCIYGLVGDNGAGKSTFLKLLAGHSFVTAGEIRLFGAHGERALEHSRRKMGCMVERPGFFPNLTVWQMLKYCCIQRGIPGNKKAEEIMELTGLGQKRDCKCRTLSLGQVQRLGLAIAMLGEPQLLVLDEPINGLDPSGILEFRHLLERLNQERNITILLSSHILAELQQVATVYGFLSKGVLEEEITAQELEERCSGCLELALTDVEQYAAFFEKAFPGESYKILPDRSVRIDSPKEPAEAYSRLAAEHGIYVTGMRTIRPSLEAYYMGLKERGAKG